FFEIIEVITQPDKKAGRKQLLAEPPIKTEALKYNITVRQPENISDYNLPQTDLIMVIAYAQILPEKILNIPKYGAVNLHGSLLPKYRGAACVQAAILNGDSESGISFIKMDAGIDTGPILINKKMEIKPTGTGGSLYAKLSELGGKFIVPTLSDYIKRKIAPYSQDQTQASYAKKLKKQDGQINWNLPAEKIERFIRAMSPWPGSYSLINTKILKILEAKNKLLKTNKYKIGEIFLYNGFPAIQCGKDALIIEILQLEGKKEISGKDFIKGYFKFIGSILK
ncbi:methionyl-tRNA formyltransferase, partial [Candidatus Falkowbacteria bacterium]